MENLWELRPPLVGEDQPEPVGAATGPRDSVTEAILLAIDRRTSGRIHDLRVDVTPITLVIRGYCATFHLNQIAQHAAMALADGREVDNQIVVW